ncbi:hypothetical protein [Sneathiella aquimaris]|uniref:hypothetical protein n=1 Tax=Sneathiella aquimaris TaxID=2599305 RepID=UPI00146A3079|nr:hypothetical protein [Sneathiella aquimaris]
MALKKYWYLGFLGMIGVWKLPLIFVAVTGFGPWTDALYAGWFLWFLNFIPKF